MYKIKLIASSDDCEKIKVTADVLTVYDVLETVERWMRGMGLVFDGSLEIFENEDCRCEKGCCREETEETEDAYPEYGTGLVFDENEKSILQGGE
jgi:hypothetical protein